MCISRRLDGVAVLMLDPCSELCFILTIFKLPVSVYCSDGTATNSTHQPFASYAVRTTRMGVISQQSLQLHVNRLMQTSTTARCTQYKHMRGGMHTPGISFETVKP